MADQKSKPEIPDSLGQMDLIELWNTVWHRKFLIIGITFVCSVIAVTYALLSTEIYRAQALLAPADVQSGNNISGFPSQLIEVAGFGGLGSGGAPSIENAKATLRSRIFAEKFIAENDLLPILFEDMWDAENSTWFPSETDKPPGPTPGETFEMFSGIFGLTESQDTGLISIFIDWEDPVLAADWVNKIISSINIHIKEQDVEEARKSIDYLTDQVGKTSVVGMQQVLYNLVESQTRTIMLADVRDEYIFKVIDPAVVPEVRIMPNRRLIAILGFLLGGLLSLTIVFTERYIRGLRASRQVSQNTP